MAEGVNNLLVHQFTTQNKLLVTRSQLLYNGWQSISMEVEMNCFHKKPSKHICLNVVKWEVTTLKNGPSQITIFDRINHN